MDAKFIPLRIVDVGPDTGEREVVVRTTSGTEFGVFDGYKTGDDGIARPATPDWLETQTVETALWTTVDLTVSRRENVDPRIVPNESDPSGFHDHRFGGHVRSVRDSTADLFDDVRLFDGFGPGSTGVQFDGPDGPVGALSVGDGNVLLDLADVSEDSDGIKEGDDVEVRAARTDVLGYRL